MHAEEEITFCLMAKFIGRCCSLLILEFDRVGPHPGHWERGKRIDRVSVVWCAINTVFALGLGACLFVMHSLSNTCTETCTHMICCKTKCITYEGHVVCEVEREE